MKTVQRKTGGQAQRERERVTDGRQIDSDEKTTTTHS